MDGEEQHLLKQIDFKYTDGEQGSLFIVTNVGDYVPEIKTMISEMMLVGVLIICFTAGILIMWVYRMWTMKMRLACSARISRRCG